MKKPFAAIFALLCLVLTASCGNSGDENTEPTGLIGQKKRAEQAVEAFEEASKVRVKAIEEDISKSSDARHPNQ
ncbi:MAG: hypothetical protein ACYYK0_05495 [Candidatus Eutrophobiaceae bacterium]